MKYLSICSGIEAASVAWHPLGWEPVAFAEIESFPSAVLAHHWPDVPNLGDITKHREWRIVRPDLIVGGTPCQAFSVAGLRKGLADPRGNLTLTFLAIVAQHRPAWVVWENVPGVLSDRTGAFGSFLGGLAELGYGWAYRVLDAQHFGVPQRRRRVFVVGCLGDWRRAAAVLFESESLRGDPPPSRETRERPAPTLSARTQGGGGLGTYFDLDGGLIPACSVTITATYGERTGQDFQNGMMIPVAFDTTQITSAANYSNPKQGDPCHPLAAGAHAPAVAFQPRIARNGRGYSEGAVPALNGADAGATSDMRPCVATPYAVRRLTPTECECLQGFPDGHTAIPWRGKPANQCPDGPRYKALGNSMAVPVMRWIGRRIQLISEP